VSVYTINEVCWRLVHDRPFRDEMQRDPAAALATVTDLNDDERRAILEGEVGLLYRMGAHAFLLGHLNRYGIAGLTTPLYNERMRAAGE
jgi:hypothetical protein